MPSSTTNLGLYKYDTATDGDLTFNFKDSLNDNWDKVDTAYKGLSDDKADTATVNSALALKADTSTVNTALALKADKTQLHALKGYSDNGELLTDAEGLADVTKYAHSTFDLSKFTVVGSPNITDDGIASDFSGSNRIKAIFDYSGNTLEYTEAFYFQTDADSANLFQIRQSDDSTTAFRVFLGSTNNLTLFAVSGENLVAQSSEYSPSANDFIILKVKINSDKTVTFTVINVTKNITVTKTSTGVITNELSATGNILYIGNAKGNEYYAGQIDLKYTSIKIDNIPVFSGNVTGIDTIKPDDYTVVGSPIISDDGILTDSISGNYIQKSISYFGNADNWEIYIPLYLTAHNSGDTDQYTDLLNLKDGETNVLRFYSQSKSTRTSCVCNITGNNGTLFNHQACPNMDLNVQYFFRISRKGTTYAVHYKTPNSDWTLMDINSQVTSTDTIKTFDKLRFTGVRNYEKLDLNAFKIYTNGSLVYQPCLKIPYTESKTGSKIVNSVYRGRVNDMAEQFGYANYYTLSDTDFTLPQGELYGLIGRLQKLVDDEIGLPKATLSNTLNDNEIWLEGAEVSKVTYAKLYAIYGDDYGIPTDSANFVLPDFRNRVMQGIGSGGTFGYISAGLPNIKGTTTKTGIGINGTAGTFTGAFTNSVSGTGNDVQGGSDNTQGFFNGQLKFNANNSNSIYKDSVTTVQPPAIKVRFKTRFQ